ncbi:Inosine triphosphate pyrophosphatase {ECO:0000255/HAMAP-Rule:MF_03148} Short=ITPase {ECO:0000255/HAMAP-Rule:MF_03148}; Short=Inosine triphosphatase {ECO:0000255/HAMAP-Rule:MF_03148}; {ECO:0000255/HAMAP-Rule:MF_03148}; AltName: Full=Non-canonical purine NTP pyrophosphatase {ECO:0000255/HAMAP-Rule:MF_03148}; AltName: Full=Non-standard purine NTP pyrophosphatase {ECO:0000255/HAMAP-Rule:MF_03148}; AltName: Full=Nucleoside-triphosphate diphosphatase {ECO:0000255/HAMAP-Rule:MF_03148}; AltName: Full=Nucleoside-tr|nr:Inosine triphosphate pyrophosphatase {ECO:0000255/HAMAP-Rule:MF_03148} Short=ITPase {ECO:0000255/HAMAP-Rule:MF_03148}; Short=Inosine triphosphatase {ECO:0000255/HAMAP-Rule:MF_03148}; {ECO:0000255/HAMAP-Rule:MF_03148}; AltName: Full=Non-canonical purine NTP pyrophosphatase {ECO:0000255/HAMAP-Rule:MF_03148}; AltName: Full=Non-standard purine NTP pyrophosphatase {ECO:0000255/HAMAP-Rule:MF_03148}; AltName: Full=Nucleoside-triphosphate diphosphatase {ECO:0000255/HAMAP-Rule:MF_03148}; AltName: Full=Nu
MTRKLVFITGNKNKLVEVQAILAKFDIEVEARALDIPEIQGTTLEVSADKCRRAAELVGGPCITEDTALAFHALGGLPGPYIKDFMKTIGHSGLNAMLTGFPTKGPGETPQLFVGETEGEIVPVRGPTHFGWDAVFQAAGTGQTFAEMDPVFKNTISHRFKALTKLVDFLKTLPE